MEEIQFDVELREKVGKQGSNQYRQQGWVPGVVYGGKDNPVAVKIDRRSFERIERTHRGENFILHLNILQDKKKIKDCPTLVKEKQYDPVTDQITHIDFIRISLTEKIEVRVPIRLKGDSVGVKEGGSIEHHIWDLDVICLPTQIPAHLDIDVSTLKMHDAIHVKDILLPTGVTTKHDLEAAVVSVVPATREDEEKPVEEVSAEPEVMKEKKKEEAPVEGTSDKPAKGEKTKAEG